MDYKLSSIINTVTDQSRIRTKELCSFPICVFVDDVPEVIAECLEGELKLRVGELEPAGYCYAREGSVSGIGEAVDYYKEQRENGMAQSMEHFYIAVFFIENQTEAGRVESVLAEIKSIMVKKGFKGQYTAGIYCFLDFENPAAEERIRGWEAMLKKGGLPVCFFSQYLWGASGQNKYRRAVSAAALHIFLNISREDVRESMGNDSFKGWKILGYWDLDIFKYVTAERLEEYLEAQWEESGIRTEEFAGELEGILDRMIVFSQEEMYRAFASLPVRYDIFEEWMRRSPGFSILKARKKKCTCGELLELLYGDASVMEVFFEENLDFGELKRKIPAIMDCLPGNVADMDRKLPEALDIIEKRLQGECMDDADKQGLLEIEQQIPRNRGVGGIVEKLQEILWTGFAGQFACRTRLRLIREIKAYLGQEEWKGRLEACKQEKKGSLAALRAVKRDISFSEGSLVKKEELEQYFKEEVREPELPWYRDIMETACRGALEDYVRQMVSPLEEYIRQNNRRIFNKFITAVNKIRVSGSGKFYTAYVESLKQTKECEYIFVNPLFFDTEMAGIPEAVKGEVRVEMPFSKIKSREWIEHSKLEMLAFKDLDTIRSIYGMRQEDRRSAPDGREG